MSDNYTDEKEIISNMSDEMIDKILEEIFKEPALMLPYESPEDRWREFLS